MLTTEKIDTHEDFIALRPAWEAIYCADIHATVYMSWVYINALIDVGMYPWFVLAFKNDAGDYVGFTYVARRNRRYNWHRTLLLSGTPIADYNSLLALPRYAKAVCTATAQAILSMAWDKLEIHNSFDPRMSVFAGKFSTKNFFVDVKSATSLYIPLPDSWETYLKTRVSKNTRKKIKRYTKAIEALPGYRMETLPGANNAAFIETIMRMWYRKWQDYWTIDTFHIYHRILQRLAADNMLWARLIYDDDTPVVGLVGILDRPHNIFFALLGSFNEKYAHLHAGKVLDAHSIHWAIENKYKIYDYMQGAFPYKFSLGAIRRIEMYLTISRKSLRSMLANYVLHLKGKDYRDMLFSEDDPL